MATGKVSTTTNDKKKLLSIRLIEMVVNCYDFVTLPIYYITQQPWVRRKEAARVKARQVEPFVWVNVDRELDKSNRRSVDTLDQLFRESVATYANRDCLGQRKILATEYKDSKVAFNGQQNGASATTNGKPTANEFGGGGGKKVISKYVLENKYTWYTYKQIEQMVIKLSAALVNLCDDSLLNSDGSRKVLICADTCMQWFLMAHACFRNNITVTTAYTTLGDDSILHIIHQTEVKVLVVSQKIAKRLSKIIQESPLIDTIVVLDEPLPGELDATIELRKNLLGNGSIKRIISYGEMLNKGAAMKEKIETAPTASDIAVLMYTSGSTGKAKGVMLSHSSIVYTALSFSGPGDISCEDRYIGYLPLGHVLELAAECIFLRNGSTIAYSSPFTLTSNSPMIKRGQRGDAAIFKPTIMGAVPLVLDRIKSGIQSAVRGKGSFYDQLINDFVVEYKRYWWEKYYDTPIMNLLLCREFNQILGGKIRAICSGGAALSRDTQEYLRHVTNYTVLQGYGLTETSAAASFCDINDRRYNVVGPPYPIVHIKLESWSDYSVNDKPNPRGEIIVGGRPVSSGYYKMDELTKEAFYVNEKTGMRYFRTGDIGMMLPDGCLKIIDRKKDIVKPLSGEYISLSEIEQVLHQSPLVETVCVYCSQFSNFIVALIRPDEKELRQLAKELATNDEQGKQFLKSITSNWVEEDLSRKNPIDLVSSETLCSNNMLVNRVLDLLKELCNKNRLKRTQIPSKIKLVSDEWTPESGLVTASFKLKRRDIERHYAEDIKKLYVELGQNIEQQ